MDNIVKRPIEEHKSNNYIKLVIPNNELLEQKILNLSKDTYVKCNIEFQGLKISKETLMEEWYITDFITQEETDEKNKLEYVSDLKIQQDTFQYNESQNDSEESKLNNDTQIDETQIVETQIDETQIDESQIVESKIDESQNVETQIDESKIDAQETQLNNDIQNYESNNETQLNNIDINNLEEEIEVISVVDDK